MAPSCGRGNSTRDRPESAEDDELDRGGRFDRELLDEVGAQLVPGGEDARFVAEDTVVVSRGEFGTRGRHHDPDDRTR